jgi:hypothetical protein
MNQRRSGIAYALCFAALSVWLSGCGGDDPDAGPDAMSGPGMCSDGVVGEGELCDPGASNGAGLCCNATCDGYVSAGTECRPAVGACDLAETCDGSSGACPSDALAAADTACRPSAGECDLAETCDGSAGTCPGNDFVPDETTCDDCALGPGNCTTCSAGVCSSDGAVVVINEIDADTATATDTIEFIELYDGGLGNTPLTGLVLVFIDGATDTIYEAFSLDEFMTNASGFFVIGSANVVPPVDFQILPNQIENGTDAVALYRGKPGDFMIGAAASGDDVFDAVVYGLAQDSDLVTLLTPGQPRVNEGSGGNAQGQSVQRVPDGAGGPRVTSELVAAPPTPGAPNQSGPP